MDVTILNYISIFRIEKKNYIHIILGMKISNIGPHFNIISQKKKWLSITKIFKITYFYIKKERTAKLF